MGYQGEDLPFLFKVLSINTALSIQAHPDKVLAQELHAKYPNIYKDSNHKPEMAIALTPFEAMCGFRPIQEIRGNLSKYPELRKIIGDDVCSQFLSFTGDGSDNSFSNVLELMFRAFMECDNDKAQDHISSLVSRLRADAQHGDQGRSQIQSSCGSSSSSSSSSGSCGSGIGSDSGGSGSGSSASASNEVGSIFAFADEDAYLRSLILRLHEDYPDDRGALCPLLLNCLRLAEGEAFFMGPNEPHAYISGDCVESMALSDNVVRAGLTPKFRDVETLCSMLNYTYGLPHLLSPVALDRHTLLYRPPPSLCAEFEVEVCTLPPNAEPYQPPVADCGSILLFFEGTTCTIADGDVAGGKGSAVPLGSVLFLPANAEVTVSSGADGVVFYRAHVNLCSNISTASS